MSDRFHPTVRIGLATGHDPKESLSNQRSHVPLLDRREFENFVLITNAPDVRDHRCGTCSKAFAKFASRVAVNTSSIAIRSSLTR